MDGKPTSRNRRNANQSDVRMKTPIPTQLLTIRADTVEHLMAALDDAGASKARLPSGEAGNPPSVAVELQYLYDRDKSGTAVPHFLQVATIGAVEPDVVIDLQSPQSRLHDGELLATVTGPAGLSVSPSITYDVCLQGTSAGWKAETFLEMAREYVRAQLIDAMHQNLRAMAVQPRAVPAPTAPPSSPSPNSYTRRWCRNADLPSLQPRTAPLSDRQFR
jgi:hypothetical protein